jgi:mono/diheme cytochrome c family protein
MKKVLRWLAIALGTVVLLLVVAFAVIMLITSRRESKKWPVTPVALAVTSDSATLARGFHLVTAIGKCVDCHGEDFGGQLFLDGMPLARFAAPNLTSGGPTAGWSDGDLARAIRNGITPDGRALIFMPADAYHAMGAEDLAAVIAYVRQMPRVDRPSGGLKFGPVGRMLWATGKMEFQAARMINVEEGIPVPPPAGPTAEYGKYLAQIGGCTSCHGKDLKGGLNFGPPGTPPSQNLTPNGNVKGWTLADFTKALRNGVRPDGTVINPFMPWIRAGKMTDEEIAAVWNYLQSL